MFTGFLTISGKCTGEYASAMEGAMKDCPSPSALHGHTASPPASDLAAALEVTLHPYDLPLLTSLSLPEQPDTSGCGLGARYHGWPHVMDTQPRQVTLRALYKDPR